MQRRKILSRLSPTHQPQSHLQEISIAPVSASIADKAGNSCFNSKASIYNFVSVTFKGLLEPPKISDCAYYMGFALGTIFSKSKHSWIITVIPEMCFTIFFSDTILKHSNQYEEDPKLQADIIINSAGAMLATKALEICASECAMFYWAPTMIMVGGKVLLPYAKNAMNWWQGESKNSAAPKLKSEEDEDKHSFNSRREDSDDDESDYEDGCDVYYDGGYDEDEPDEVTKELSNRLDKMIKSVSRSLGLRR